MLKLLTKKDKCEANFKPKELDVLLAKIAQKVLTRAKFAPIMYGIRAIFALKTKKG